MRTAIPTSHLTAEPGRTTRVEVEVTNTADIIDGVTAIVDGINPSWVRLDRPLVTIFPESTDRVVIHLDVPATCQAGDYLVDIRIVSAVDPSHESSQDFWLTVPSRPAFELGLHPSLITAGTSADTTITIRNTGNCDVDVELSAVDPSREVTCDIDQPRVKVPFEASVETPLHLEGRRPWFGQPANRTIQVKGIAGDRTVEQALRFNQRPRIPRGVITIVTLACIIALWAAIFLLVVSLLRGQGATPKIVADEIDSGRSNIPLDLIRGTVTGSVVGGPDLDGIPAVTVTAFRIADTAFDPLRPDAATPRRLVNIASGGTIDDGSFGLRTLVPGRYLLHFTAPGFDDVWFPSELDSATPPLRIRRLSPIDVPDIVMLGRSGTVSATIELPPNTDVTLLTAVIVPVDQVFETATVAGLARLDGVSGLVQGDDGGPVCDITADNPENPADPTPTATVVCSNVPTPGEYLIEITGDGFVTQRLDVTLQGGDDSVVDTVRMSGRPGSLTGSVQDQNGRRLAGATVTVSSGQFVVRIFSDSGGRYLVDELPTPADYVVDVSLEGYVGQTSALELQPDTTGTVDATLVAGLGSIEGTVVAAGSTPVPLGAVQVTVTGERSSARTATLTDGARGSFRIEGLSVPGSYSVSFGAPGFLTETRIVEFDDAQALSLGQIPMFTAVGQISGTVVDPLGRAVAGATVELTDGLRTRTTTTSTTGTGAFGFQNVLPGSYSVIVRSTDGSGRVAMYAVLRTVGAGGLVNLNGLVLPLTDFGRIGGTARDPNGNPLGNVFVTLRGEGTDRSTSTDDDGAYVFANVDVPGQYVLAFELENHALEGGATTMSVDLAGDGIATGEDATLIPLPGSVTGTVRTNDAVRQRLATAQVMFRDDSGIVHQVVTGQEGTFFVRLVDPGVYTVETRWCSAESVAVPSIQERVVPAGGIDLGAILLTIIPEPTEADLTNCPIDTQQAPPPTTVATATTTTVPSTTTTIVATATTIAATTTTTIAATTTTLGP